MNIIPRLLLETSSGLTAATLDALSNLNMANEIGADVSNYTCCLGYHSCLSLSLSGFRYCSRFPQIC